MLALCDVTLINPRPLPPFVPPGSVSANSSVDPCDALDEEDWDLAELDEGCEVEDRPACDRPSTADVDVGTHGNRDLASGGVGPMGTPVLPLALGGVPCATSAGRVAPACPDSSPLSPSKSAATLAGVTRGLRAAALQ